MLPFLQALIPVIIIVAIGRFLAWRNVIAPEGWRGIERVSYFLLFPALIIREIARAPLETAPWGLALALVGAQLVLGAFGLLAGMSRGTPAKGSIIQSNVRWTAFVALSIAARLGHQPPHNRLYYRNSIKPAAIAANRYCRQDILSYGAICYCAGSFNGRRRCGYSSAQTCRVSHAILVIDKTIGSASYCAGFWPASKLAASAHIDCCYLHGNAHGNKLLYFGKAAWRGCPALSQSHCGSNGIIRPHHAANIFLCSCSGGRLGRPAKVPQGICGQFYNSRRLVPCAQAFA